MKKFKRVSWLRRLYNKLNHIVEIDEKVADLIIVICCFLLLVIIVLLACLFR